MFSIASNNSNNNNTSIANNKSIDNDKSLNLSSSSSASCFSSSSTSTNNRISFLNEINRATNSVNNINNNNKMSNFEPAHFMEHADDKIGSQPWVPPNDRELIMRARLKTGWSSRSNFLHLSNKSPSNSNENINQSLSSTRINGSNSNLSRNGKTTQAHSISDAEFQEIEQVMQRASAIEQKEIDRINKLYQRYNTMNRPLGNGETTCIICNSNFGILGATPHICSDCFKNVCTTCSVDALSSSKQTTIWLCKICAEYRDFLKKSGAWFSKRIPLNKLQISNNMSPSNSNDFASPMNPANKLKIKDTNIMHQNSSLNKSGNLSMSDLDLKNSKHGVGSTSYAAESGDESGMKKSEFKTNSATKLSNNEYDADDEIIVNKSKRSNAGFAKSSSTSFSKENLTNKSNKDKEMKTFNDNFFGNDAKEITVINKNASSYHDDSKLNFELDNQLIQEQIAASRRPSTINANQTVNNSTVTQKTSSVNRPLTSSSESILKLQPTEEKTGHLGSINFTVEYIPTLLKLKIHLISGSNLPSKDSNGFSDPYVKLHLLPGVAKSTKLRSKTVYKNLNPNFNETFYYEGVTNEDLDQKTLRLTVLDEDKFGFDFIGEYRLPLKTILRNEINNFSVPLEEKQEFGDETDVNMRGKINFAIKYSKNSNCLFVKINRCTQLIPMDNGKSSDPFVELTLVPSSKENKQRFKSSVKWKTLDPEYLEEFKFTNIDLKTLLTKTIEINVWDKDLGSNDFIGQVLLGQQRTGEELKHFFTMIKNPELYHEQWHTLHLKDTNVTDSTVDMM